MWADVRAAFAFLTVLPLAYPHGRRPGWSFSAFPLVGLVIGLMLAAAHSLPLPQPDVTALLVLLLWIVLTGGLHLDGLADSADGLCATTTPERRLEIMRDPRTGSWGVIALVMLLLGKWIALRDMPALWLIVPPVLGRWVMVLAAWQFPPARRSGLGTSYRDGLTMAQVALATLTTLLVVVGAALAAGEGLAIVLMGAALVTGGLLATWAAYRLNGGLTGDVYGALCEVTELVGLLGVVLWLGR